MTNKFFQGTVALCIFQVGFILVAPHPMFGASCIFIAGWIFGRMKQAEVLR